MPEQKWRVGRTLGRTLYIGDRCIGMVDTPELAAEIVAAVNTATELRARVDELTRANADLNRRYNSMADNPIFEDRPVGARRAG